MPAERGKRKALHCKTYSHLCKKKIATSKMTFSRKILRKTKSDKRNLQKHQKNSRKPIACLSIHKKETELVRTHSHKR